MPNKSGQALPPLTLESVQRKFESHADPEKAVPMQQYMRDQFKFLGIQTPVRNRLTKELLKEYVLPSDEDLPELLCGLWALPEREYPYFALAVLERLVTKRRFDRIDLLEELVLAKSWWDTVDVLAPRLIGPLLRQRPEWRDPWTLKWVESDNIWLKRTALLFQLKYKDKTDLALLGDYIERCADHPDFFVRKAIGWALREIAKTYPEFVRQFVSEHILSPLSEREALKHLT